MLIDLQEWLSMRITSFLLVVTASLAVVFLNVASLRAQTLASVALTGQVGSAEEGAMEGVLVSAKRVSSTITVTVVSDSVGRYSFPRSRLEPGQYSLRIRAVGYELDDPGAVEIASGSAASVDLKLRRAKDLASQITNAEWILSMPGKLEHARQR